MYLRSAGELLAPERVAGFPGGRRHNQAVRPAGVPGHVQRVQRRDVRQAPRARLQQEKNNEKLKHFFYQ